MEYTLSGRSFFCAERRLGSVPFADPYVCRAVGGGRCRRRRARKRAKNSVILQKTAAVSLTIFFCFDII